MSQPAEKRERPLSPHLDIYKFSITMTMSILHRITGVALYLGTLLFVLWLTAAAFSDGWFILAQDWAGSILGQLVLFGYTWALIHHMLGGIRHFIWDFTLGLERTTRLNLAWFTIIGSLLITGLIWLGVVLVG